MRAAAEHRWGLGAPPCILLTLFMCQGIIAFICSDFDDEYLCTNLLHPIFTVAQHIL
jgi:hypothetical protein